jgi:arylsulfatase A-like enzyme
MIGFKDHRFRAPGAVLVMLVVLVGSVACAKRPTETRVVDLVVEGALFADGRALRSAEVFANDETWFAVALSPGQRVTTELVLGRDPVLKLGGCVSCEESSADDLAGVLRGGIGSAGDGQPEFEIGLGVVDRWWQSDVLLEDGGEERRQLWFEVELPEGCSLLMREATIRHRMAVPQTVPEPPIQILLISVDTLRYDAVGASGGDGAATPNLDRLATESESFSRHYAAASWTKPSHASMLTGYHPKVHRAQLRSQAMDPSIRTLAGRFRDRGLSTAALVFDCGWLSPQWGFSKGFDSYRVSPWRATRQALWVARWILDHRSEPFFFFFHTFEPHSDMHVLPYEAPGVNRSTIALRFGVEDFGCRQGRCASGLLEGLNTGLVTREPQDAAILRDTYGAGVRYLDTALGTLFDILRESEMWQHLLVVVTSDHGEEFSEHGGFSHRSVYDEIVRVPLLVKWPHGARAGLTQDVVCSSVDLAPTLLEFAGCPTEGLQGSHIHRRDPESPIFSGTLDRAVLSNGYKAIFSYRSEDVRLFNLEDDPEELTNLAEALPDRVKDLKEILLARDERDLALWREIGSVRPPGEVELSEGERERLKAFGYLSEE